MKNGGMIATSMSFFYGNFEKFLPAKLMSNALNTNPSLEEIISLSGDASGCISNYDGAAR